MTVGILSVVGGPSFMFQRSADITYKLQSWSDAFRGDPRLQGVCQVYDELKAKGVEFPMTDFDTMAPIITPKRVS